MHDDRRFGGFRRKSRHAHKYFYQNIFPAETGPAGCRLRCPQWAFSRSRIGEKAQPQLANAMRVARLPASPTNVIFVAMLCDEQNAGRTWSERAIGHEPGKWRYP